MPTNRGGVRFLLRGSLLVTGMLTLWWLALQTPLLAVLRLSEDLTLRLVHSGSANPISVEASGDWTFWVPVEPSQPSPAAYPAGINSIEFSMSRSDLVLFTFSLPMYCAIALAAPLARSSLRALISGAAIVTIIEILSMLGFIEITAHSVLLQMLSPTADTSRWPSHFANYLLTQVIPFAAPVLVAVASRRELRSCVIPHGLFDPTPQAQSKAQVRASPRRAK